MYVKFEKSKGEKVLLIDLDGDSSSSKMDSKEDVRIKPKKKRKKEKKGRRSSSSSSSSSSSTSKKRTLFKAGDTFGRKEDTKPKKKGKSKAEKAEESKSSIVIVKKEEEDSKSNWRKDIGYHPTAEKPKTVEAGKSKHRERKSKGRSMLEGKLDFLLELKVPREYIYKFSENEQKAAAKLQSSYRKSKMRQIFTQWIQRNTTLRKKTTPDAQSKLKLLKATCIQKSYRSYIAREFTKRLRERVLHKQSKTLIFKKGLHIQNQYFLVSVFALEDKPEIQINLFDIKLKTNEAFIVDNFDSNIMEKEEIQIGALEIIKQFEIDPRDNKIYLNLQSQGNAELNVIVVDKEKPGDEANLDSEQPMDEQEKKHTKNTYSLDNSILDLDDMQRFVIFYGSKKLLGEFFNVKVLLNDSFDLIIIALPNNQEKKKEKFNLGNEFRFFINLNEKNKLTIGRAAFSLLQGDPIRQRIFVNIVKLRSIVETEMASSQSKAMKVIQKVFLSYKNKQDKEFERSLKKRQTIILFTIGAKLERTYMLIRVSLTQKDKRTLIFNSSKSLNTLYLSVGKFLRRYTDNVGNVTHTTELKNEARNNLIRALDYDAVRKKLLFRGDYPEEAKPAALEKKQTLLKSLESLRESKERDKVAASLEISPVSSFRPKSKPLIVIPIPGEQSEMDKQIGTAYEQNESQVILYTNGQMLEDNRYYINKFIWEEQDYIKIYSKFLTQSNHQFILKKIIELDPLINRELEIIKEHAVKLAQNLHLSFDLSKFEIDPVQETQKLSISPIKFRESIFLLCEFLIFTIASLAGSEYEQEQNFNEKEDPTVFARFILLSFSVLN